MVQVMGPDLMYWVLVLRVSLDSDLQAQFQAMKALNPHPGFVPQVPAQAMVQGPVLDWIPQASLTLMRLVLVLGMQADYQVLPQFVDPWAWDLALLVLSPTTGHF